MAVPKLSFSDIKDIIWIFPGSCFEWGSTSSGEWAAGKVADDAADVLASQAEGGAADVFARVAVGQAEDEVCVC